MSIHRMMMIRYLDIAYARLFGWFFFCCVVFSPVELFFILLSTSMHPV